MKLATVTLAIVLAIAGCVGSERPAPEPLSSADEMPFGPEVSEDRGAIRGVIVDDQIQPVANANITLETGDAQPTTLASAVADDAGEFLFPLLEPGTYRVRGNASGFNEAASFVSVRAGEVASARLELTQIPLALPYVELKIINGIAGCDSIGVIVSFIVLGGICPTQIGQGPGYEATFPDSWRHITWEITWADANQFLGYLVSPSLFTCDQEPCYGVTLGPPPIRLDGSPGQKMQDETEFFNAPTGSIIAYPEGAFSAGAFAYNGGLFGRETTQAMASTGYCPTYCYGVGTTPEVRFAVYESTFHHAAPPDPSTYSALPDA